MARWSFVLHDALEDFASGKRYILPFPAGLRTFRGVAFHLGHDQVRLLEAEDLVEGTTTWKGAVFVVLRVQFGQLHGTEMDEALLEGLGSSMEDFKHRWERVWGPEGLRAEDGMSWATNPRVVFLTLFRDFEAEDHDEKLIPHGAPYDGAPTLTAHFREE